MDGSARPETPPPVWMRIGRCAADPAALLPDLAVLAAIAPRWRELAGALAMRGVPADLSSPAQLLALTVAATTRPEVKDAFAATGLATEFTALDRRRSRLAAADQPWGAFLRPAMVAGSFVVALPPRVDLPPVAAGVTLLLAERGTAAITCETGTRWPFAGDGPAPGLLRLTVTGDAMVDGHAMAGVGAGGPVEASFFVRAANPDESAAGVLRQCLPLLPDPFDPAAVGRAGALAGVAGVVLRFTGEPSGRVLWLHTIADTDMRFGFRDTGAKEVTGEWAGSVADVTPLWRLLATGDLAMFHNAAARRPGLLPRNEPTD